VWFSYWTFDSQSALTTSGIDEGIGEDYRVHAAITYLQSHSVYADHMNHARARPLGLGGWQRQPGGNLQKFPPSPYDMKRCGAWWKKETASTSYKCRPSPSVTDGSR
jgi:hypothetical protein